MAHRTLRGIAWAACSLAALLFGAASHGGAPIALTVSQGERLLVIAPHPDDETLGVGGLVQAVLARGGSARVTILTAGDGFVRAVEGDKSGAPARPAQYIAYGERRIDEAASAVATLGKERARVDVLGFPDTGLSLLLSAHWKRGWPVRSATTGAMDPPYEDAAAPDAPYTGSSLYDELVRILRATRPTLVALPDPLDAHPDHRAAGLFTLLALDAWSREAEAAGAPAARVLAYLVHWPGWPSGWSRKPGAETEREPLDFPKTLPRRGLPRVQLPVAAGQIATKRAALLRYETQQVVMDSFLLNFARASEPFTVMTKRELRGQGWVKDLWASAPRAVAASAR